MRLPGAWQDFKELQKLDRGTRTRAVAKMASYASPGCRRKALLGFLGERRAGCQPGEQICDFCLVCLSATFESTEIKLAVDLRSAQPRDNALEIMAKH